MSQNELQRVVALIDKRITNLKHQLAQYGRSSFQRACDDIELKDWQEARATIDAAIEALAAQRGEVACDDPTVIEVLQEITRTAEKLDGDCDDCYHVACVANGALARIGVRSEPAPAHTDEEMATRVWKRTEAYIRGYEDGKHDCTQAQAETGDADRLRDMEEFVADRANEWDRFCDRKQQVRETAALEAKP